MVEEGLQRRPLRTIETPGGSLALFEGGVVLWTIPSGSILDERAATRVIEAVSSLTAGVPFVIVGDATNLGFADWSARDLFANSEFEGRIATGAVVSSRVVRWLADQYVRRVGSQRSIQVFDRLDDALAWAENQVRAKAGD